jgi:hypothetical protein
MKRIVLIGVAGLLVAAAPASADVIDSAANGFTVKIAVETSATASRAYAAIVNVAGWWDPEHSWSGKATNLSLDATAGGCFCERLANGGSVRHLTVVYADPNTLLRLNGGLGPMQDMAVTGSLTFVVTETMGKAKITLTYKAGGYLPGGLDAMAKPSDGMLTGAMQRLKQFIDTGRP